MRTPSIPKSVICCLCCLYHREGSNTPLNVLTIRPRFSMLVRNSWRSSTAEPSPSLECIWGGRGNEGGEKDGMH